MTNDVSLLAVGLGLFYSMGGYCSLGAQKTNQRRANLQEETTISAKTNFNTFLARNVSEVSSSSFAITEQDNAISFATASTLTTDAPRATSVSIADTTSDSTMAISTPKADSTIASIATTSGYPFSDTQRYAMDTTSPKPIVQNTMASDSSTMTLQQKVMPPPSVSLSDTSTSPALTLTPSLPQTDTTTLTSTYQNSIPQVSLTDTTTLLPKDSLTTSLSQTDTTALVANNATPAVQVSPTDTTTLLPQDSLRASLSQIDTTALVANNATPAVQVSPTDTTTLLPQDSLRASLSQIDTTALVANNATPAIQVSPTDTTTLLPKDSLRASLSQIDTTALVANNATPAVNVSPTDTTTDITDSLDYPLPDDSTLLAANKPDTNRSTTPLVGIDTAQSMSTDVNTPSTARPRRKVNKLEEVVVNTALGFQKSAKSLSYSAQTIKSDELNAIKGGNFTNTITGKASNVTISEGSGGVGSATKITLRGNNSLTGTGAPLIVIDGMPVTNENPRTGGGVYGNNFLSPDGLSSINPDDIESMTILKGPAAAALYGSQAANGALLITTKSGKDGVTRVDVSTNTMFSTPAYYPKTQNKYGSVSENYQGSWGPQIANGTGVTQFLKDFYQTGLTTSNTVSFTAGNEKAQVFTSYANTYGKGLIPNNTLLRHNFDIRGTANFFKKFIEVDAKISYMQSTTKNPFAPGLYLNPLATMYSVGANLPMNYYKNNYTANNGQSWYNGQNWTMQPTANDPPFENPYWLINRVLTTDVQQRWLASANVKFNFTDWLNLQVRGTMDNFSDQYNQKQYQGTNLIVSGVNGNYAQNSYTAVQYYTDALLSANKDLIKNRLHLNALVGGSLRDYTQKGTNISAGGKLFQPNFFDVSNINFIQGGSVSPVYSRKQIQSLFYSVELSYRNAIFITHTGRNDWSSTLPANANSYYYPSIGGAVVLTDLIKSMTSYTLSYLKLRASYTQVGNDLPAFITNPVYTINSSGGITKPGTVVKEGTILKPEITTSIEAGLDVSFFNNLIYLEGTYYKTNTVNQLFTVAAPSSSGFSNYYVNGGNVQNEGVELSLSISPKFGQLEWVSTINFSKNINRIVSLIDGLPNDRLVPVDNSPNFLSVIKVGGKLHDMYAQKLARNPDGSYITQTYYVDGRTIQVPTLNSTPEYVGNPNPDFMLSWGNSFSIKGVKLSFLIDGRFGGKVISLTQSQLDAMGNSVATANARDNGGVNINGSLYDAQSYYGLIGGRNGAWGEYVYDATVIRLREVSISYSLPASLLKKTKVIKGISLALVGRNLFYFYKPAPVDAEVTSSTNSNQFLGVENFNIPASRSFGFSVNLHF